MLAWQGLGIIVADSEMPTAVIGGSELLWFLGGCLLGSMLIWLIAYIVYRRIVR